MNFALVFVGYLRNANTSVVHCTKGQGSAGVDEPAEVFGKHSGQIGLPLEKGESRTLVSRVGCDNEERSMSCKIIDGLSYARFPLWGSR